LPQFIENIAVPTKMTTEKSKRWNIFKWGCLAAAFIFLLYRLICFQHYEQLISQFKELSFWKTWFLWGVMLLLPANWLLESVKWQRLVRNSEKIDITSAFHSVMAGFLTAFFTPNRVGEVAGRIAFLQPENRKAGVTLSLVNSATQNIIMAVCGIPAAVIFFLNSKNSEYLGKSNLLGYFVMVGVILLLLSSIYFSLPKLVGRIKQKKSSAKWISYISCLTDYSFTDLLKILLLSFLRYLVFSFQFYLMLRFFGVEITGLAAAIAIPTTYLFVTFTPSMAFSEAAIRSSYSVLVIGAFSGQTVQVILASTFIWIVNFVVPMLVGSFVLMQTHPIATNK
jgi:hypothetical protein